MSDAAEPQIRPLRTALWTAGAVLLVSLGCIAVVFVLSREFLLAEVRQGLMRSAQAAAAMIDPLAHIELTSGRPVPVARYDALNAPLRRPAALGNDFAYLYTMVREAGDDGRDQLSLVLDSSKSGAELDSDHDGLLSRAELLVPYDMGEFYDSPDTVRQTLINGEGIATTDAFSDEYGTFISAFCALRQGDAVIAAAGVDLNATYFLAQSSHLRMITLVCAAVATALSAGIGVLVWRSRRRELQLELGRRQAAADLRRALDNAQTGERAKAAFLAVVSHELRTPLNGVIGLSDLVLAEDGLLPAHRDMIGMVRRSGHELLALVEGILDYTELDTGQIDVRSEPFDPARPLESVAIGIGAAADAKGLDVALAIDPLLAARVIGDQQRVRQMLAPLAANAVKFTSHGRILLCADAVPDGVRYRIADSGPGLPESVRQQLFTRFVQGECALNHHHRGTGLGLATVLCLTQRLGGRLTVGDGPGTDLSVILPLPIAAPARAWPPVGVRSILVRHHDAEIRAALLRDCVCLGLQPVDSLPADVLIADLATVAASGGEPGELAGTASLVIALAGHAEHARWAVALEKLGVRMVLKPATRLDLGSAINEPEESLSALLRALPRRA